MDDFYLNGLISSPLKLYITLQNQLKLDAWQPFPSPPPQALWKKSCMQLLMAT